MYYHREHFCPQRRAFQASHGIGHNPGNPGRGWETVQNTARPTGGIPGRQGRPGGGDKRPKKITGLTDILYAILTVRGITMKNLKGIFPALLTPFTEDGKINEDSLRKLVAVNLAKGVTGFYVCGSTAEVFLLKPEERKRILEIVVDEVKQRAAVICHVGNISTEWSIEFAKHAASLGVDAISSIPPFYYNFTFDEIYDYYVDILSAVDLPMIVYNFPAFSGVTLTIDRVKSLRKHKNVIGIKHTSTDVFQINSMRKADPDLLILNGYDEIFLAGYTMGADGGIGSTYNVMAEKFINIKKQVDAGNIEEARRIQTEADDIIRTMTTMSVFNAEKYLLTLQGIPFGECRKPFKPLTIEQKTTLEDMFERTLKKN
jgi:N-acetylneuraminate lyase